MPSFDDNVEDVDFLCLMAVCELFVYFSLFFPLLCLFAISI